MSLDHIPTPFVDAAPYRIQSGDQIIYDTRSGTLFLHAADGSNVALRQNGELTQRCFVQQHAIRLATTTAHAPA